VTAFSIVVNGRVRAIRSDPATPLLWVLRDELGLTGTKYGCGIGVCGACTVHLDGAAERSCLVTAQEASGRSVTTIEGLACEAGRALRGAWVALRVPQCGYCQPAQLLCAAALLARKPKPTDADIEETMTVLCRCGTYQRIRAAIRQASGT
jgi:isoquinoline 1-oxidoreductase alpha subunit